MTVFLTRCYRFTRYYPGEWSSHTCRAFLEIEIEDKKKAFEQIYRHHSPCFRYFFVEKFGHQLEEWYTAKQRYARSTAVNSVVGHILGIGDRHSSNILIHKKTAELVHIDFGIVFEQGKLLRTPERGKQSAKLVSSRWSAVPCSHTFLRYMNSPISVDAEHC